MRYKLLYIIMIPLCAIGMIISLCSYTFKTNNIKLYYTPLVIENGTLSYGLWGKDNAQFTLSPNNLTLPDIKYKFFVNTDYLSLSCNVSWNQEQLNLSQPMITSTTLTNSEYTYLTGKNFNLTEIYQVNHTHNSLWLILCILLFTGIIFFSIQIAKHTRKL